MSHYIYILQCNEVKLYVGYTSNLEQRLVSHNIGTGAKYTKIYKPCKLVYFEEYLTRSSALKREIQIKGFSRNKKLELVNTLGEDSRNYVENLNSKIPFNQIRNCRYCSKKEECKLKVQGVLDLCPLN